MYGRELETAISSIHYETSESLREGERKKKVRKTHFFNLFSGGKEKHISVRGGW